MKKIFYCALVSVFAVLSGCSEFKEGEGGLLYKIVDDYNTPNIAEIAFVSVSYTESTEKGTLIAQTGKLDPRPSMLFARMPEFKGDFQDALQYLSEGDSAIIKISIDSLKKKNGLKLPYNDSSKYMIYNVRVNKVINKKGALDTTYPKAIEQYKAEQEIAHRNEEKNKIQKYLAKKGEPYQTTNSGLIVFSKSPASVHEVKGKYKVNYTFYTLDGKIMDTNKEGLALSSGIYTPGDEYIPLELGRNNAPIAAFKEALSLLPPGKKVELVIPSHLAFGNYGNSKNVPAFMPLLCEFEILNNVY